LLLHRRIFKVLSNTGNGEFVDEAIGSSGSSAGILWNLGLDHLMTRN
jgi:hypothetical protein